MKSLAPAPICSSLARAWSLPRSWMSCRLRQALATGHEEAQATATGQKKKFAAAGDNEQAIAETPSSGMGKGQLKDMPSDCYS